MKRWPIDKLVPGVIAAASVAALSLWLMTTWAAPATPRTPGRDQADAAPGGAAPQRQHKAARAQKALSTASAALAIFTTGMSACGGDTGGHGAGNAAAGAPEA